MIKLRKWLSVVYLLSCAVLITGLFCYWFGLEPVYSFMGDYRSDKWLQYIAWALLVIVIVGTFIYVIRTLSQRGKNTYQRRSNELGAVQVSRSAIVHEVNGVIDAHPEVKRLKTSVTIKNRRNPYANVTVRVSPRGSLEMPVVAAQLQQEVKDAVVRLTGNDVRNVTIDIRRGKKSEEAAAGEEEPKRIEESGVQAHESLPDVMEDASKLEEPDVMNPIKEVAYAGEPTTEDADEGSLESKVPLGRNDASPAADMKGGLEKELDATEAEAEPRAEAWVAASASGDEEPRE